MHAADVFQCRQDHRAVAVPAAGVAGEGIQLLRERTTVADEDRKQFPPEQGDFRIVPVVFEGSNRALIGKALGLAAPIIAAATAEERLAGRNRNQWNRRPEFIGIQ